MINELLQKVVAKENLTFEESKQAINEIMSGEVTPAVTSAFLTALAMKGETEDEIAGAADGMREKATPFELGCHALDVVGTGGDKSNSFNISTTSGFVAAAAGVTIAKHGNRAASSKSGTADCLEALGVKIDCEPELMRKSLSDNNIVFFFAQKYHSAMRFVGPIRKEIGIRTVFNILGPLTNPGKADRMLLGVFSKDYVEKIAKALVKLGVKDAMVVYGLDGLDEISACGETFVAEVRGESIKYYTIKPEDFGFERVSKEELKGGDPAENAEITKAILSGGGTAAQKTAVALNAGACIYVDTDGITLKEGIEKAKEIMQSGKGYEVLQGFIRTTNGE
ncbi:MAG: anthranilate phosphoribosyltransferase [Clostridium sp.]|nr:anthranilate phosphoribosyltransferase [Clostridium sp.]